MLAIYSISKKSINWFKNIIAFALLTALLIGKNIAVVEHCWSSSGNISFIPINCLLPLCLHGHEIVSMYIPY